MSNVLIIGGGFAGVWSAAAAVRAAREAGQELTVTLVSPGDDLVIRPRLYEADPHTMCVPLDRVLGPIGVRRIAGTVTDIDPEARTVTVSGQAETLSYDRLVLAAGSQLVRPDLPGAEHLHDVDTLPAAAALDAHLHRLPERPDGPGRYTVVIVGAGFTGIELATELPARLRAIAGGVSLGRQTGHPTQAGGAGGVSLGRQTGHPTQAGGAGGVSLGHPDRVRVVLVERSDVVGPELGAGPRPTIEKALTDLAVEARLGVGVREIRADGVTLSDGTDLAADTVVWTAGVLASPLTAKIPAERDRLGRLAVDEYLAVVGVPGVYAAGDTAAALAEDGHHVMQSCQHANPQGRFAGHNVAADLLGLPREPFAPVPYVTCLDLGGAGAVFTTGWERSVELTDQAAKQRKQLVNQVWIYPPVDDAEELLRQADFRHSTRRPFTPQPAA